VSLLDQLVSYGAASISLERVQDVLGLVPRQMVQNLVRSLVAGNMAGGLSAIADAIGGGADAFQLSREIVEYLRGLMLLKMSGDMKLLNVPEDEQVVMKQQAERVPLGRLVEWVKLFNQASLEVRLGVQPQLPLELAVVGALTQEQPAATIRATAERAASSVLPHPTPTPVGQVSIPAGGAASIPADQAPPSVDQGRPVTIEEVNARWAAILAEVRQRDRQSQALLRDSSPIAVQNNEVLVGFYYDLHKRHMEDPRRCAVVQQAMEKVLGRPVRVKCTVASRGQSRDEGDPPASSGPASFPPDTMPPQAEVSGAASHQAPDDKYRDVIASDRLIREAVHRFGAKISDVQFSGDEED
jgi:DNA polymerase-3 subunit gamma/tau